MKKKTTHSACSAAAALACAISPTHATDITWIGANNGQWGTETNWSTETIPTIADNVTVLGPLNVAGALTLNTQVDMNVNSISFTNTAATTFANNLPNAAGNARVLNIGAGGISTGTGAVTTGVNANNGIRLHMTAAQAWSIGSGGLTVNNNITGTVGLAKAGSGTLTYQSGNSSSFTGGLTINGGTFNINFTNLVSPTNLVQSSNALTLGGGGLTITGRNNADSSQAFNGTTLNAGRNTLNASKTGTSVLTVNLGALTTNPGSTTFITPGTLWGTNGVIPTDEIIKVTGITGKTLPEDEGTENWINVNAGLYYRQTAAGSARWINVDDNGQLVPIPAGLGAQGTSGTVTVGRQVGSANVTLDGDAESYGLYNNSNNVDRQLNLNGFTYTINGIIGINSNLLTIVPGDGGRIIIGSEKNLVINSDTAGGTTITAPIDNNGSTGGVGGDASSVTIAGTRPSGGAPGTITLSAKNTYSGGTHITSAARVLANHNNALGTAGATIHAGAGNLLRIGDGITIGNPLTIQGGGVAGFGILYVQNNQSATYAGDITITGDTNAGGHFGSNANNTNGELNLTGKVTYTGGTVTIRSGVVTFGNDDNEFAGLAVQHGTAKLGIDNALATTATVTLGQAFAATLDLSGFDQTLAGIVRATSAGTITNSSDTSDSTLTITGSSTFSGVIEDGDSMTTALTVDSSGTLTLSGNNTYTGPTTVNAGTLLVNNAIGDSDVTVNAGTLGGTGAIGGDVTIGDGTGSADAILAPGTSIGSLATGSLTFASDGSYSVELDGTSATGDQTIVTGSVQIDPATTLSVDVAGTLAGGQRYFIILNADEVIGTFAGLDQDAVVGTYGGTDLLISYTGDAATDDITGGNDIVLYTEGGTSPYEIWAALNGLDGSPGKENGKFDDPDQDGRINLMEFAFDGNPLSGTNDGKVVGKVATVGGEKVLTLTVPVRDGAVFTDDNGTQFTATAIDGVNYRIEGDETLDTFADTITEVTGADATAIQAGLPVLSTGWTYRTFRAPGTVQTVPKAFLRAQISE